MAPRLKLPITIYDGKLELCDVDTRLQRCRACDPEVTVITACEPIEVDLTGLWIDVDFGSCDECPAWATTYEVDRAISAGRYMPCRWEETFELGACNNDLGLQDPTSQLHLDASIIHVQDGDDCDIWLCVRIGLDVSVNSADRTVYVKKLGTLNATDCVLDLRGTNHTLVDNGLPAALLTGHNSCGDSRGLFCFRTEFEIGPPWPEIEVTFP